MHYAFAFYPPNNGKPPHRVIRLDYARPRGNNAASARRPRLQPSGTASHTRRCNGHRALSNNRSSRERKRARLEDPRKGGALEKSDALVIDGQQFVNTIRDGQLRRADLYLRKLRRSDASFGGLRLVVVATSGDARSAVLEAASSPDMQLRSVVDRLDLSYA